MEKEREGGKERRKGSKEGMMGEERERKRRKGSILFCCHWLLNRDSLLSCSLVPRPSTPNAGKTPT